MESREDDDRMLHAAHASRYHWGEAPECEPANLARGEWQISRVYMVLGRAEPAIWHAQRCLEHCEEAGSATGTSRTRTRRWPARTRWRGMPRRRSGRRRRAQRVTRSSTPKIASTSTRTSRRCPSAWVGLRRPAVRTSEETSNRLARRWDRRRAFPTPTSHPCSRSSASSPMRSPRAGGRYRASFRKTAANEGTSCPPVWTTPEPERTADHSSRCSGRRVGSMVRPQLSADRL